MKLEDKVAIVTGSSRGIGKAIALAMAKEGAAVVVAARSETASPDLSGTIHETAEMIHTWGGQALAVKTDVSNEQDVEQMVQRTVQEFGKVDILVNNAGILICRPIVEMSVKHWDLTMRVNLRGTFLCTRAVLPHIIKRKSGSIINVSSWLGKMASPGSVAYSVSKAGIEYFTLGLAEEVREFNIAVNSLSPGTIVDSEGARFAFPGADRSAWEPPELMAEAAVFLATQDAQSLTGMSLVSSEWKRLQ